MAKKSLETLTESMFYVLLALSQGDKCGTEITDFICNLTRPKSEKLVRQHCILSWGNSNMNILYVKLLWKGENVLIH